MDSNLSSSSTTCFWLARIMKRCFGTTGNRSSEVDPGNNSGGAGSTFGSDDTSNSINQNQGGALAQAQESSLNNNHLFIDVDFEDTDDTMGDLQSPQYVKRTAHMFDSRFSTNEHGNDRNGRNPSYLNVSRSVSGYSCLTYNNGTVATESVSKTVLGNGTSLLTTGSRVSAATPRIKTDFAIHHPFTRTNKVPNTDDDSSDHSSNQSATSPPPSLPPINTTHSRLSESAYFQNGVSRREDSMEDTPYIPSHGKSFVMQRIERLYGSDAVSNKGVLGRKSSSQSHVTTISITNNTESPRGSERIIPIKVEPRNDLQKNLYNTNIVSSKKIDINVEDREGNKRTSSGPGSTGLVLPDIRGRDENNHRVVEHHITRVSVENNEDTIRSKQMSPARQFAGTATAEIGNLNGNANCYRNGVTVSVGREERSGIDGIPSSADDRPDKTPITLEQVHANSHIIGTDKIKVDGQVCSVMKKSLSRESSAESDETAGCSEASLDLGSISDSESSNKFVDKHFQDSNRGSATSPSKPKPKPKPKDMALLRTLSRSPAALNTGNENLDKTAVSLSYVKSADATDHSINLDETDGDNTALSNIKNTVIAVSGSDTAFLSQDKVTSSSIPTAVDSVNNKENSIPPSTAEKLETNEDKVTLNISASSQIVKDGNYFLGEMSKVKENILKFSEKAAKELESLDPSEDRAGSIHAAVGKGNLLVKKKFKQFEELCQANLRGAKAEEPETTNEDLAGFWDMVLIQVDQIYSLFEDLENKDQGNATPKLSPAKVSTPKKAPASTSRSTKPSLGTPKVNSAAAKARDDARRKMLAEKRRAMKNQLQETSENSAADNDPETEVQIFAPDAHHTG